jgi:hypothetical protein
MKKSRRTSKKTKAVIFKTRAVVYSLLFVCVVLLSAVSLAIMAARKPSILANATFYSGSYASPKIIRAPGYDGKDADVMAFPGQVILTVTPATTEAKVSKEVTSRKGKIIGKIPALGFYQISVAAGKEADFIKSIGKVKFVRNATLNIVVYPEGDGYVDLGGKGKRPEDLVTAIIGGAPLSNKVVNYVVDNFTITTPTGIPHGVRVTNEGKAVMGDRPIVRIQATNIPCGGLNVALCSNTAASINGVAAAIAGAEVNGQKANINLSWGPHPVTTNPAIYSSAQGENANSWALPEIQSYVGHLASVIDASLWAQKGNVILNEAAGNGARVVNQRGETVANEAGVDMTPLMSWLNAHYGNAMKSIRLYGALEQNGELAPYSNFGDGLIYATMPPGASGTSHATPQGWGAGGNVWADNPKLSGPDVNRVLGQTAAQNDFGFPVLNPAVARMIGAHLNTVHTNQHGTVPSAPPMLFNPPSLGSAKVGQSYSFSLGNPTGGRAPYQYAVVQGRIPDGLTLSTDGVLSGTPTNNATYNFTVCAIDANGNASCRYLTLAVQPADQPETPQLPAAPTPPTEPEQPPAEESCEPSPDIPKSNECGSEPVYDCSSCNGLPSGYISGGNPNNYKYEDCLTACQSKFSSNSSQWSSCMGY